MGEGSGTQNKVSGRKWDKSPDHGTQLHPLLITAVAMEYELQYGDQRASNF